MGRKKKLYLGSIALSFVSAAVWLCRCPTQSFSEFSLDTTPCPASDRVAVVFTGNPARYRMGFRFNDEFVPKALLLSGIEQKDTVADLLAKYGPSGMRSTDNIAFDYSATTIENASNTSAWLSQQTPQPCEVVLIDSNTHWERSAENLSNDMSSKKLKIRLSILKVKDHNDWWLPKLKEHVALARDRIRRYLSLTKPLLPHLPSSFMSRAAPLPSQQSVPR